MSLWWTRTAVENKPGLTERSTRTCENASRLLANVLISGSLTENDSTDRERTPLQQILSSPTHPLCLNRTGFLVTKNKKTKSASECSSWSDITCFDFLGNGMKPRTWRLDQTTTRTRREAERYLQTLSHCSAVEDRDHCTNGLWKHQGETHKKPLWLFNLIMHEGRPYRNTGSRFNNSLFFFSLLIQSKLGVSLGLIALLWSQAFTSAGPLLDDDGIPSAFS